MDSQEGAVVRTVLGPVTPSDIGPTLMHEHLFFDMTTFWDPDSAEGWEATIGLSPMEPSSGGPARWNMTAIRDNLIVRPDEHELVAEELGWFTRAGGSCVVDLTTLGLRPSPERLVALSTEIGIHIVAGCGVYTHRTHEPWVDVASEADLTAWFLAQVTEGIMDSGVRPGIIGEIGISDPIEPCEERVLRASARVAVRSGLAINVHLETEELASVMRVIDVMESAGCDPQRTILHHLDEIADPSFHREVLARGVVVGFEGFGTEGNFDPNWRLTSDAAKLRTMAALAEAGYLHQLTVSQDVSLKSCLRTFGGMGFDHVMARILPTLVRSHGLTEEDVASLLVHTPRRLLSVTPVDNASGA